MGAVDLYSIKLIIASVEFMRVVILIACSMQQKIIYQKMDMRNTFHVEQTDRNPK